MVRSGPIVAIQRDTRSIGPPAVPLLSMPRSSAPRSTSPSPVVSGVRSDRAPPSSPAGAGSAVVAPGTGSTSKRNRQSSTVRQAQAPGPTATISTGAPVGVTDRPVSSLTCSSAILAISSNLIRSPGSTLPSASPFVAAPWARVRASSIRPPPGVAPPMSWRRSPRSCSSELPPPPGPGLSTSQIVGGAGAGSGRHGPQNRRRNRAQPEGVPARVIVVSTSWPARTSRTLTAVPGGLVYRLAWRSARDSTGTESTASTTSP